MKADEESDEEAIWIADCMIAATSRMQGWGSLLARADVKQKS